ncbi:MAG: ABC transporter ATP-binding protein [Saccharofermentanales bacterium]
MRPIVLQVEDLTIHFGGIQALEAVSFYVEENRIAGLIGPNGAGKTTVFNLLTGVYAPDRGDIYLDGRSLLGKKTYQRCQAGLARTFQNIRLFKDMTVEENVTAAMVAQYSYPLVSGLFRGKGYRRDEKDAAMRAEELLELTGLAGSGHLMARQLPYGQQRKLEIARALATRPQVLLLDEPAAGMNPAETSELKDMIRMIRDRLSISVLLIEHDMNVVMDLCEYIFVLDYGRIICRGQCQHVQNDPKVIEAYLGGEMNGVHA